MVQGEAKGAQRWTGGEEEEEEKKGMNALRKLTISLGESLQSHFEELSGRKEIESCLMTQSSGFGGQLSVKLP